LSVKLGVELQATEEADKYALLDIADEFLKPE
jgi:hypothetical protein